MTDSRGRDTRTKGAANAGDLHRAGVLSLQAGQFERAAQQLQQAVRTGTASAPVYNDLGVALGSLGRIDDAVSAFRAATELEPDYASAWSNLGCALAQLDQSSETAEAYQRAIDADPGLDDVRFDLALLYLRMDRAAEAVTTIEGATQAALATAGFQLELGRALARTDDSQAAERAYRRCLSLDPDLAAAHTALGDLLNEAQRIEEAIPCFARAAQLRPDLAEAHFNLGAVRLANSEPRTALESIERSLSIEPCSTRSLALKTIALHELGDRESLDGLVDFEHLVSVRQIVPPSEFARLEDFNEALSKHILEHPTLVRDPKRHATRNGLHSGNLLAEPKGPVAGLEKVIKGAVLDYIGSLPATSDHPFVTGAPRQLGMEVWAIVLDAGGHQISHIHPGAWLSGVYYVRVPQAVDDEARSKEGWIAFNCTHPNYPSNKAPENKEVKPAEGLMILFPSYLYHHTVPFTSTETRISIAFDVYLDES